MNPALCDARIDFDRARLAFDQLAETRRAEILAAHARPVAATGRHRLRRRSSANARQRASSKGAIRAAENARSEAERLVATELARLLGIERSQVALRERFEGQRSR